MARNYGKGSIYKRKDGRWTGEYTDPITEKRKYVYGKTQKEVKEKIREKENVGEVVVGESVEKQIYRTVTPKKRETKKRVEQGKKAEELKQSEKQVHPRIKEWREQLIQERKEGRRVELEEQAKQIGQEEVAEDSLIFREWLKDFLYTYKQKELKATTFGNYLYLSDIHIEKAEFAQKKVSDITIADLQKYYNQKIADGYNSRTIKHIQILVNEAMDQAVRMGYIASNPNQYTKLPRMKKFEAKILTEAEVGKLIQEGEEEWVYPIVVTCVTCGLRKGEILGLRWGDVDFEKGQINVRVSLCRIYSEADEEGKRASMYKLMEPKTKSSIRSIPMMEETYRALYLQRKRQDEEKKIWGKAYMDNDLVFAKADGSYINPRHLSEKYTSFLKKYGVTVVRFHDLRHTYASILMANGVEPKIIQELLGHSSISTTLDIYTHINNEAKEKAIHSVKGVFAAK